MRHENERDERLTVLVLKNLEAHPYPSFRTSRRSSLCWLRIGTSPFQEISPVARHLSLTGRESKIPGPAPGQHASCFRTAFACQPPAREPTPTCGPKMWSLDPSLDVVLARSSGTSPNLARITASSN